MFSTIFTALKAARGGRRRPTAPVGVRVAVWALFVLLLGVGVAAMPDTGPQPDGSTAVASAHDVGIGVYADDEAPVIPDPCGNVPGADGKWPARCTEGSYHHSPERLLPAYRWQESLEFTSNLGVSDGINVGLNMFAQMVFVFANVLWSVNLWLIAAADRADFLGQLAAEINGTYVRVMNSMWGLVALGYFVVLVRMARQVLRGDAVGVFRVLAGFVIPVAFVVSMVTKVEASNVVVDRNENGSSKTSKDVAALKAAGSPAWIADQVVGGLDQFGGTLALVFDPLQSDTSQLGIGSGSGGFECSDYINTLEKNYLAYSNDDASGGPTLFVSKMWTLTVFDPWSIAALGDQPLRHRASCHLAEWTAKGSVAEKKELADLTWGRDFHESLFRNSDQEFGKDVWSEIVWHSSMWQACEGASMNDGWAAAMEAHKGDGFDGDQHCADWLAHGMDDSGKLPPDVENLYESRDKFSVASVDTYLNAALGHNGSSRLVMAIVSSFGAIIYLWAFAGAAIGVFVSKIGLVLALMLLPFTLTMIGLGTSAGQKMLRWTASLCAIDLMFTVVLALLFQITLLGVNVIGGWGGAFASGVGVAAGPMKIILISAIPIASVLAVNRILKGLGIGKITNPISAVGLVGRASAKAFNSPSTSEYIRGAAKEGAKKGIGKVNAAKRLYDKARDPFDTGRHDLKKNAANAVALHKKGLLKDKTRDQAVERHQLAEAKHREKLAALKQAKNPLGLLAAKRSKYQDLDSAIQEWAETNKKRQLGEKGGGADLDAWRRRAQGSGPGSELVEDAARRRERAEQLNREAAIATLDGGTSVGEIGGHMVHSTLAQHAAAARFGDLAGLDTSDLSSLVVPGALRAELMGTAAADMGLKVDQVMMDHFGNVVPDPTAFESMAAVPESLRSHPVFHLDPSILGALPLETDADRATRITGILAATGYMGVEGGRAVTTAVWGADDAPSSPGGRALWAQLDNPATAASAAAQLGQIVVPTDGISAALCAAVVSASRIDSTAIAEALRDGISELNSAFNGVASNLEGAASRLGGAATRIEALQPATLSASPDAIRDAVQQVQVHLDAAAASGAVAASLAGLGSDVARRINIELDRIGSASDAELISRIDRMTDRLESAMARSGGDANAELASVVAQLRAAVNEKVAAEAAMSDALEAEIAGLRSTLEDRATLAAAQQVISGDIPDSEDGDAIAAVIAEAMEREQARLDEIASRVGGDASQIISFFEQAQSELRDLASQAPDVASTLNEGLEGLLRRWEAGMHRYSAPTVPTAPIDPRGALP